MLNSESMLTLTKSLGNSRGFTLMEMLVATSVAGVLLATSIPSLGTALSAHYLQSGLRTTANYVRVVRSTAVARNLQARLVVSEDGSNLSTEIYRGSWQAVGSPVDLDETTISAVSPTTLTFTPQGNATAATTLTVRNGRGGTATIAVSILGSVEISS